MDAEVTLENASAVCVAELEKVTKGEAHDEDRLYEAGMLVLVLGLLRNGLNMDQVETVLDGDRDYDLKFELGPEGELKVSAVYV